MRIVSSLVLLALLASCGADGAPTPPSAPTPAPGFSVSGQAKVGVSGSL